MITLGIKTTTRDNAIQFLRDRGVILDYAPEVTEDVPDTWAVKLAATFDKEPTADDIAKAMETVLIPAHTRVVEPEKIAFDAGVQDTDGLLKTAAPIKRVLTAATDKAGAVMEDAFYAVIRFKGDDGGLRMAAELDKGGTVANTFKLAARAEMLADAAVKGETLTRKEGRSRTIAAHKWTHTRTWFEDGAEQSEEITVDIAPVTIFQIDGENGVPSEELGRKYL